MTPFQFERSILTFFRELAENNNRAWFAEHKNRFETTVRDPLLAFVDAVRPRLRKISSHFVADSRPVGGSVFRIYRDTRFSADKRPYKTHLGVQFRHELATDVHAPGFYLHVEPGRLFVGAGIWRPDSNALETIRRHIAEHPDRWRRASRNAHFRDRFELSGDVLKRAPRGIAPDHPLIDDLRRKDFIAVATVPERVFLSATFLDEFETALRASRPFVRELTKALDLPW